MRNLRTVAGTVDLRKEQVRLVRSRFEGGIGNELDIARAETELATTEVGSRVPGPAPRRTRKCHCHSRPATTRPASGCRRQHAMLESSAARVPVGLPADLLERRPDVSEAERQLASANARIGVAKAAFFPVFSSYRLGRICQRATLIRSLSGTAALGPSGRASRCLFSPAAAIALTYKRSQAAFQEALARYRQQVLVSFGRSGKQSLRHSLPGDQATAQARAVANARRAADLATDRYRSGIVSYLEVVDASREALQAERGNAQLAGQRLIAAVQLIKALGGGWNEDQLLAKSASAKR